MASTNKTTNYELSQFVGTDKPTFLGDYNGDMQKIDTAIAGVATTASGASSTAASALTEAQSAASTAASAATTAATADTNATAALTTAGNAATAASAAQSTADSAASAASAADAKAVTADSKADDASAKAGDLTQLTTTAKTDLVAAINEVNAKPSGGGTAASTTYDNTTSGLTATNVQDAIDEIASAIAVHGAQYVGELTMRTPTSELTRGSDTYSWDDTNKRIVVPDVVTITYDGSGIGWHITGAADGTLAILGTSTNVTFTAGTPAAFNCETSQVIITLD